MRFPHLLVVEAPPEAFATLVAAAAGDGARLGWLDWSPAPPLLPPDLEAAAALGVLRAVAVAPGRAVTVKPLAGPAVLRDLVREHFLGCRALLVRGAAPAAGWRLDPGPAGGWRLSAPGGAAETLTTAALLARLRRPRLEARRG